MDTEQQRQRRAKKRAYFAYVVFGAIAAIFLVTTVFQWKGISIQINTEEPTAQADELQIGEDKEPVTQAVEKAGGAVVGISNIKQSNPVSQNSGTGSGVIYKKEQGNAYIVTNHHVVENAEQLEVILNDGTKIKAELEGSDPLTDLAVLKIDDKHVKQVAKLGDAKDVEVGQTAIAIGNPLGMEFAGSATKGIVSGLNRNIPVDMNKDGQADWQTEVIQTDAAINPGNSGGALINLQGDVIGINTMKIAQNEVEGLGFSIPMDVAKPVIKDLENNGEVKRPYMGVSLQDIKQIPANILTEQLNLPADIQHGVIVGGIEPGSPADKAGLKKSDVITEIEGNKIESLVNLRQFLYKETEEGKEVELTFYRNGEKIKSDLQLSSQ
ncbi:putative serine protease YyxA [Thalassobacillus devorans]|uniref:Serine protease YyxA n=1 Tax=Thalassobacillus devorans TaxID=279813 RepID=A0ABQ1PH05_9BACI|nr:trypsin-like peptidase domain-containing protein [Thalassobacillus devorans]NIK29499.1 serine protease Do [Thalassobacillus devorans]GGC97145.1 putative serine protease YyxA [Thalassobacillus devorans]